MEGRTLPPPFLGQINPINNGDGRAAPGRPAYFGELRAASTVSARKAGARLHPKRAPHPPPLALYRRGAAGIRPRRIAQVKGANVSAVGASAPLASWRTVYKRIAFRACRSPFLTCRSTIF